MNFLQIAFHSTDDQLFIFQESDPESFVTSWYVDGATKGTCKEECEE